MGSLEKADAALRHPTNVNTNDEQDKRHGVVVQVVGRQARK